MLKAQRRSTPRVNLKLTWHVRESTRTMLVYLRGYGNLKLDKPTSTETSAQLLIFVLNRSRVCDFSPLQTSFYLKEQLQQPK